MIRMGEVNHFPSRHCSLVGKEIARELMNRFASPSCFLYAQLEKSDRLFASTLLQDASCRDANLLPGRSRNYVPSLGNGEKSLLAAPLVTRGQVAMSISMRWNRWPKRLPKESRKGPSRRVGTSTPNGKGPSSLAPVVGGTARCIARHAPSRFAADGSIRASRWPPVLTAVGTFSPQRPLLRLDGHGYSPAVVQCIVSAG